MVLGDDTISDGQVTAREFGPRAAVEVADVAGFLHFQVGMAATDGSATALRCMGFRPRFDLLATAEKSFTCALSAPGHAETGIESLQSAIDPIGSGGNPGMLIDEGVELVAMQDQDPVEAALQDVFVRELHTDERGDELGGAVVISIEPDDGDLIGHGSQQRQDLPVVLFEPSEVMRVENVAVENESRGRDGSLTD